MTAKPTARKRPATPIISQRLQLIAQAAARLAKAERLVKQWLREADSFDAQLREVTAPTRRCDTLRRCARELSRILKP